MTLFNVFKRKKKKKISNEVIQSIEESSTIENIQKDDFFLLLERLPENGNLDETGLVEITNSHILGKIESFIFSAGSTGLSIKNAVNSVKGKNETLYKIALQKGGQLANSTKTTGAKKAFTIKNNRIQENADLIPVFQTIDTGAIITNVGAAAMNVASMVVGQYYMSQIDARLNSISNGLSKIIDFLDIQYKSQVASLTESVYAISKFKISSLENEELRNRELDNLQSLRNKCQELLNQAETTLETLIDKNCSSYNDYEKTVKEIND